MATAQASTSGAPAAQEFSVRVPKDVKKKYSIMKFSMGNNVDFTKCGQAKIEKENNFKQFKQAYDIDVMPKFGAGSEFGREQREEARRKKYGIRTRKYNTDDQPWLLKMGTGKTTRRFKGTKEGGVAENASYYVFTQCPDGAFEAFPIQEWFNFTSQIKYKALTSEEAEAEFSRRDKNLNMFSIMVKKRIAGVDNIEDPDEEEGKKTKGKKKKGKDFLLTELDDWAASSDDEDDDDSDREGDEDGPKKPKPAKKAAAKKKKMSKTNSDDEAVEESDDADETREVDYMSNSESDDEDMYEEKGGDSDEDKYKEQGVEDEDGLRKALNSDEEDEEEENKEKKEGEENEEEETEKVQEKKKEDSDSESSSASDSDSDPEKEAGQFSAFFLQKKEKKEKEKEAKSQKEKGTSSRSSTPTSIVDSQESNGKKRSLKTNSDVPTSKKAKIEPSSSVSSLSSLSGTSDGITDESVRRYLMRKPMTTKELLQKFKSKKNIGMTKDEMVTTIAQILKRLNPEKNKIKDKLYLSIKKQE